MTTLPPTTVATTLATGINQAPASTGTHKPSNKFKKNASLTTFENTPTLKDPGKRPFTKMIAPVQQAIDSIHKAGGPAVAINMNTSGRGMVSPGLRWALLPLWDFPPFALLPWLINRDIKFHKAKKQGLRAPEGNITVSYERHLTRNGALKNIAKRLDRLQQMVERQGRAQRPVFVPFAINQGQSKYVSLALVHPGDWKEIGTRLLAESQKQFQGRLFR